MEQFRIKDAFPERFNFFGFGQVERTAPYLALQQAASPFVVIFKITGDEVGHCIIAFDKTPSSEENESMAVEIANILTSKFVTQLSDFSNALVELSPPEVIRLGERRHRNLVAVVQSAVTYRYEYRSDDKGRIGLRMTYLPARTGNT